MTLSMLQPDFRLRFFFDPGSGTCLWSANKAADRRFGYPVRLEKLPVSSDLAKLLHALMGDFDSSIDWNDPAGPSPWSADDEANFFARADTLLTRLQDELGPAFLVVPEHRSSFHDR